MTLPQRKRFIKDITASLKKDLLDRAAKMPEEWDGIEIRQWVKDYCEANITFHRWNKRGKRYQDYKNEVLVRNLT